jgi:predicted TIM-barrel fold metal-dependent hydrolase
VWVDIGTTFGLQVNAPVALAETMAKLIKHIGADRICWGTDTPVWGSPQWQIEALRKLTIPDELVAGYGYPELTDAHKDLIFGGNMARLYGIDVAEAKARINDDRIAQARAVAG